MINGKLLVSTNNTPFRSHSGSFHQTLEPPPIMQGGPLLSCN